MCYGAHRKHKAPITLGQKLDFAVLEAKFELIINCATNYPNTPSVTVLGKLQRTSRDDVPN